MKEVDAEQINSLAIDLSICIPIAQSCDVHWPNQGFKVDLEKTIACRI